ncbi:MAG TPA: hypothetical protein VG273_25250 [Bryobacteraceae bacterium]|jgi:hypothetical protein|nr:hypothetical protein [Bryobacteraceae bacterium]
MLDSQRLEFVTRHFWDLRRIRWVPVQLALILAVAGRRMSHLSVGVARALLGAFLLLTIGFYWWATVAIRRRYGAVQPAPGEGNRMMKHPVIAAAWIVYLASLTLRPLFKHSDTLSSVAMLAVVLVAFLSTILDRTNIPRRRIADAIGMIVLFGAGTVISNIFDGAAVISLAGLVWFSLSLYDFQLLRRTFGEARG